VFPLLLFFGVVLPALDAPILLSIWLAEPLESFGIVLRAGASLLGPAFQLGLSAVASSIKKYLETHTHYIAMTRI
jgi:hypothetical protein